MSDVYLIDYDVFYFYKASDSGASISNAKQLGAQSFASKNTSCPIGYDYTDPNCTMIQNNPACGFSTNGVCDSCSNVLSSSTDKTACSLDYLNLKILNTYSNNQVSIETNSVIDLPPIGYTLGFWVFRTTDGAEVSNLSFTYAPMFAFTIDGTNNKFKLTASNLEYELPISPSSYTGKWVYVKYGFKFNSVYYTNSGSTTSPKNAFYDLRTSTSTGEGTDINIVQEAYNNNSSIQKIPFPYVDNATVLNLVMEYNNINTLYVREVILFRDYVRTNFEDL